MVGTAVKKTHKPVVGAANSKQAVKTVHTTMAIDVFVSCLHPCTAAAEVTDCVNEALGSDFSVDAGDIACNKLKPKYEHLYSSFHVSVRVSSENMKQCIALLMSPDSWPCGLLVRR